MEDSSFNSEITKFSSLIKAPDNLKKKLEFVGLIENKENILEIQKNLKPGQILVSKLGEIWRWDGYVSKGKQNNSTKAILEQLKNRRIKQLSAEEKQWNDISAKANQRIEELNSRQNSLIGELSNLQSVPEDVSSEKLKIQNLIDENKNSYEQIAEQLRQTEQNSNEINKKLKLEEIKLNELREERIRTEGQINTINEAIKLLSTQVKERLSVDLEELYNIGEIDPNKVLGETDDLEKKLERLIAEQERLGGVNLLAEQEVKRFRRKSKYNKERSKRPFKCNCKTKRSN